MYSVATCFQSCVVFFFCVPSMICVPKLVTMSWRCRWVWIVYDQSLEVRPHFYVIVMFSELSLCEQYSYLPSVKGTYHCSQSGEGKKSNTCDVYQSILGPCSRYSLQPTLSHIERKHYRLIMFIIYVQIDVTFRDFVVELSGPLIHKEMSQNPWYKIIYKSEQTFF